MTLQVGIAEESWPLHEPFEIAGPVIINLPPIVIR